MDGRNRTVRPILRRAGLILRPAMLGRPAEAAEGVVTIRSNRLSQDVLRGISAAPLLPDERPE